MRESLALCHKTSTEQMQSPREAAVTIVSFINHRNPNVNLLALSVCEVP